MPFGCRDWRDEKRIKVEGPIFATPPKVTVLRDAQSDKASLIAKGYACCLEVDAFPSQI